MWAHLQNYDWTRYLLQFLASRSERIFLILEFPNGVSIWVLHHDLDAFPHFHLKQQCVLKELIWRQITAADAFLLSLSDRTFHKFRASRSGNQRILCKFRIVIRRKLRLGNCEGVGRVGGIKMRQKDKTLGNIRRKILHLPTEHITTWANLSQF